MSDRTVHYYTTGLRVGDWNSVMNRIEANKEWAIVHDTQDEMWEVWCEDLKNCSCFTKAEAEEEIRIFLRGEARYK
jgi:hypothetical protein